MARNSNPPSYTGNPSAVPSKPVVQTYPTPNLDDRVYVIRVDSRKPDFALPSQGDSYAGPQAQKYSDFQFATAKATDQVGWIDLFYVNERENQDEYNFEVAYPWVDRDFPQYTRTYVVLRDDTRANEPQADEVDPVHDDLFLIDHKWIRLQDPIFDSIFIGVQRVYEKLPSPEIISYDLNQAQQVQTIVTQDVIESDLPVADAVTEVLKVDRKGTAKATVITATVPQVFPDTRYQLEREDRILPFKFRTQAPMETDSHIEEGEAQVPELGQDDWSAEEHQTTEFKKFVSRSFRSASLPITLIDYKLDNDQRLVTVTDTWDTGLQTFDPFSDLVEGSVTNLGNDESILSLSTIEGPFPRGEFQVRIPDLVPEKFRAAIPIETTTLTSEGIAEMQVLDTGELEHNEQQQSAFWKRVSSTGRDAEELPITLIEYKLTENKQIEEVSETYDSGLQTFPDIDELTVEAAVDNLGNDTSLLRVGVVSELFTEARYGTKIPDIIPERFRVVVPTETISLLSAGEAEPPELGVGDLSITEEQVNDFVIRTTTETRAGVDLPVSLVFYKMTKDKQIETVTETYDEGLQTLTGALSELTIEADTQNLGNDTSLKTIGKVSSLFAATSATAEIPDLVPEIFKALFPTYSEEVTEAGTITNPPVLDLGVYEAREAQTDAFTKRRYVRGHALPGLPTTLISGGETFEDYGGGIVAKSATIDDALMVPDEGLLVVESKVTNLGNGLWLKDNTALFEDTEWPILIGTEVDPRTGIAVGLTKQVVAAGTEGGISGDEYTDVKPIDKWRSIQIVSKLDAESLPETATWETTADYTFKNELLGISWLWASVTGPCCYDFETALITDMKEGYSGPCRARITESYSLGPPTDEVCVTTFCPQAHTLGFAWAIGSGDPEECNLCKASAQTFGISSSLHDEIEIGGAVVLDNGDFTSTLPATEPISNPAPGETIVKSCEVERWRFNVFFRRLTEIFVPECGVTCIEE